MKTEKRSISLSSRGRALKSTLFAILLTAGFLSTAGMALAEEKEGKPAEEVSLEAPEENSLEGPVVMDAVYGYRNTAKSGRFMPLSVTLENRLDTPFTGTFCILTMEPSDYSGQIEYNAYRYEYPVELEGKGMLTRSYSVSVGAGIDQMYLLLLDENGKEVGRKRLKLDLNMDTAELFVGVLSDSADKLSYLDNVGINFGSLRTRLIELSPETLPKEERGLDQLDVLLITDFDTGELAKEQVMAIREWTSSGGTLLFGTGERGADTLRAFRSELLESPVPQAEEYEVNMGVAYAEDNPQGASIPLTCTEVSLKGGTELLASDELSVVTSTPVGNGQVAAAVYDFKDIQDFCSRNPSYVSDFFRLLLGENKISALSSSVDYSLTNHYWSVQGMVSSGNINKLPKVGLYVTLAVAYVALAGPGLYIFFKQRKIVQYYLPAVGLLSICCTGIVFLMGSATRFQGPFFTYASILETQDGETSETLFINMRAPYNKPYTVEIDPAYSVYPLTGNPTYGRNTNVKFTGEEEPAITISRQKDATRLSARNVGPFNSRLFQLERSGKNEQEEGFTGEIHSFDGKVTGSITNNFDEAAEKVAVLLYNQMLLIDRMEPGETVCLDDLEVIYGATNFGYATASRITGEASLQQQGDTRSPAYIQALERANILSYYIQDYVPSYHTDAKIVGFSQDRTQNSFLTDGGYETYGATLLTSGIEVDYEQDGRVYRSAMQKAPNVLSGDYYASNNTMYGTAPLILEYFLGNDIEVEKLAFHQPDEQSKENLKLYYTVPFEGKTYFYNYNTGNYDPAEDAESEYGSRELEPYLSPGNTLTVKYIYESGEDYTWNIMLPVLTVTGRSK